MHPAAFYYGTMGNFTHWEGDDPQAWSLPYAHPPPHFSEPPVVFRNSSEQHDIEISFFCFRYFPHTDTTVGMSSDCVQLAVEPCPGGK